MALELIGLAVVANLIRSWVIEEKFGMIPRFVMWLDKWHDEREEKGKYEYLREILNFRFGLLILQYPLMDMSTMQLNIKENLHWRCDCS